MGVTQQAVITKEEGMGTRELLVKARLGMLALADELKTSVPNV